MCTVYKVLKNGKFIGITESNREYATKYWHDYSRDARRNPDGHKFTLKSEQI